MQSSDTSGVFGVVVGYGRLVSRGHVGSLSLDAGGLVDKGSMFGVVGGLDRVSWGNDLFIGNCFVPCNMCSALSPDRYRGM